MKLNLLKAWYSLLITFFICCERLEFLKPIDGMHIKHYLLMITIVLSLIVLNGKRLKQVKEFIPVFVSAGILYIISLAFQIKEGAFKRFSLEEVYYFIIPLIFAIILLNSTAKNYLDDYINLMFNVSILSLIYIFISSGNFSLSNFIALFNLKNLFIDSTSPIKESDLSIYFTIFYIYYSYKNDRKRRIAAFIFSFLSYKRFSVLFVILCAVFLKFIPRHKKVPKFIYYFAIIAFIIAPFVVYYMCDDTFVSWFYRKTGVDFNYFTMSRLEIINAVIDAHLTNYGLGTTSYFLESRGRTGQFNMHNDILRIYMETTIIGTITFTYSYFKITKHNIYEFIIMLFIFFELFVAHFLASGTITLWILTFMILMQMNIDEESYKKKLVQIAEENKAPKAIA